MEQHSNMWKTANSTRKIGSLSYGQVGSNEMHEVGHKLTAAPINGNGNPEGKIFVQPTANDILCGRGRIPLKHPGNVKFFATVRETLPRYVAAPRRKDKSGVVADVIRRFQESGARFLKQDTKSKLYYVITAAEAKVKTGHAIRDLLMRKTSKTKGENWVKAAVAASKKKKACAPREKTPQRSESSQPLGRTIMVQPTVSDAQDSVSSRLSSGQRNVLLRDRLSPADSELPHDSQQSSSSSLKGLLSVPTSLKQLRRNELLALNNSVFHAEAMPSDSTSMEIGDGDRNPSGGLAHVLDRLSHFHAMDDDEAPCSPSIFDMDVVSESRESALSPVGVNLVHHEARSGGRNSIHSLLHSITNDEEEDLWYPWKPRPVGVPAEVRSATEALPSFPSAFSSWDFSFDDPVIDDADCRDCTSYERV